MNSRHYLMIVFVLLCLVAQFMKPDGDVARMAKADRAQQAAALLLETGSAPQVAAQTSTAAQPTGEPQISAAQLWAAEADALDAVDNDDGVDDAETVEIGDYQPDLVAANRPETPAAAPKVRGNRDTGRMLSDPRSPEEMDSSVPFNPVVG